MNKFLAKTLQGDRVVWIIFALLFGISMVEMFSASSYLVHLTGSVHYTILRHLMFFAIGFMGMMIVQMIDFKYIRLLGYAGLVFSWGLLILTMFFGTEQAGAARWIEIGGFQFQPSEVAKLSLIIVIADQVERLQNVEKQNKYFWYVIGAVVLTCGMIFTENFSTAAILFVITMTMMWIGEINWKKLATVCGAVVGAVMLILFIAWVIPEEVYREYDNPAVKVFKRAYTWTARIENFFEARDKTVSKFKIKADGSNFQENHAQMAIARGGFIPHGPGTSMERNYLPEAFSDFIFAIIVEELSVWMGLFVILLYLWLLFRAGRVAQQSDSLFCAILVIGVTMLIVLQAFIHIGVSVHLGPVTGQPLPLISRGGTSVLVNCVYFGLIISVTRHIQLQKLQKEMMNATAVVADTAETNVEQTNSLETEMVEEVKDI
ncbi:MAG: FtsW/RodA/SpoVE family cell cycle protein [Paludibacteraceae bacterium]|nr:FtsW/RodA/SpoVE family cell cycle protein [Paludibacteraceae bacterium]